MRTVPQAPTVINTAEILLRQGIPLVVLRHRLKAPVSRTPAIEPFGEVYALRSTEDLPAFEEHIHRTGPVNLGAYLGPQKLSQMCILDIDGREGLEQIRRLGVSSKLDVWIARTGSGNYHVYFWHPEGVSLERKIKKDKLPIDLLVNGYAILPPSDTSDAPKGGGLYSWLPDHSPWDIPSIGLSKPTDALVEWWLSADTLRDVQHAATGWTADGGILNTIEDRQSELDALHARIFAPEPSPRPTAHVPQEDDQAILARAYASKHGHNIRSLMDGDLLAYPSHSEADLALCSHLAYWFKGDPVAVDRVFRQSGLIRTKWGQRHFSDGRTYGHAVIAKAVANLPPPAPARHFKPLPRVKVEVLV